MKFSSLWLCLTLLCWSLPALAGQAIVHVVRPGETLASIAESYYGDPRRESVIVAENGLKSEGGSAIVVGLRLTIPTVSYHRVQEDETWAQLAKQFYGDARSAFVLIEANGGSPEQPDLGAELVIPYPLRHVVGQHGTLPKITKLYFKKGSGLSTLRRFNQLKSPRLSRGQIVLVPLENLSLSEEGKKLARQHATDEASDGHIREKQAAINDQLPILREHVRRGRFADAAALANRLIGAGDLTGNQIVTIQRELGTALIAMGREDLALVAFKATLAQQPDLELDSARSSPKVLKVFNRARAETQATKGTPARKVKIRRPRKGKLRLKKKKKKS